MKKHIKTEHAGSKKGKGFWGRKKEAKAVSRKKRRTYGKIEVASDAIGFESTHPFSRRASTVLPASE